MIKKIKANKIISWAWLLIVFAAFTVKLNTFTNELVWDDFAFIIEWQDTQNISSLNSLLVGNLPDGHQGSYRPVRSLFYLFTQQVFGTNPIGYHLLASINHTLAAVAVYLLAKRLNKDHLSPIIAGLLFAIHPISVEATTWITASFDAVGITLALYGIYFYLNRAAIKQFQYLLSLILSGLAMFTNELVLLLPGLIVITDLLLAKANTLQKVIKTIRVKTILWLPFLLLHASYWLFRAKTIGFPAGHKLIFTSLEQNLTLSTFMIIKYLGIFFWPFNLTVNYQLIGNISGFYYHDYNFQGVAPNLSSSSPTLLISFTILALLIYLAYKTLNQKPIVTWSLLWFVFSLIPALPWFPYGVIFAERYLYLAVVGPIIALTSIIFQSKKARQSRSIYIIIFAVLLTLATTSYSRNQVWQNSQTLWRTELAKHPNSATLRTNLGLAYQREGRVAMATELFESAVKINPNNVTNQQALVRAYTISGKHRQALESLQYMLRLRPNYFPYLVQAGDAAYQHGDVDLAKDYYQQALKQNPSSSYVKEKLNEK